LKAEVFPLSNDVIPRLKEMDQNIPRGQVTKEELGEMA
jgi:hypothetical protein